MLWYKPLSERARLESELRYWIPVGGSDFAGSVLRYGVGLSYDLFDHGRFRVTPVAEFVGWTVLSGKEGVAFPSGVTGVLDAAGDTIVNAKIGVRMRIGDWGDIYTGYGRVLTGERWYENIYRLEFRLFF